MKTISILVPESSTIQAIADPQNLFAAINQYRIQMGKKPMFKVQLVGAKKVVKLNNGATHNSVLEYIHRVKVEAAKRSFEISRKNINEVMFDVGYSDTKAFRTIFKKITSLTPAAYKTKYRKQAVI